MTTAGEIIRAAIPGADKDTCEFILWERTPFPVGRVSPRELYQAASGWRRACDNDFRLCDFCHNIASDGDYTCPSCRAALNSARSA